MAPFERAMVVSYRLSIVTVALSVTIQPQFAIECLWRSNQQGEGGHLGVDSWCLDLQRASIPGRLMVNLFQKNSNLCDHNPPTSQTDGQTTYDRKTALCTKVHRAVKTGYRSLQAWHTLSANVFVESTLMIIMIIMFLIKYCSNTAHCNPLNT